MAEHYYPFDSGNGASVTQAQWQRMAQYFENSGVCGGSTSGFLKASAPGTGMTVTVSPGEAFVRGFFYYSDANITVTHLPNNSGSPVIDLIVLRLDTVAKTISIPAPIRGVPGANPAAPTPTFPSTIGASVYEIPLAQVRVESGVSTIASDKVTDARQLTSGSTSDYVSYTPVAGYNPANWTVLGRSNKIASGAVHVWGFAKYLGSPQASGTSVPITLTLPYTAANLTFAQQLSIIYVQGNTPAQTFAYGNIAVNDNKFSVWAFDSTAGYLKSLNSITFSTNDIFRWNGIYETGV